LVVKRPRKGSQSEPPGPRVRWVFDHLHCPFNFIGKRELHLNLGSGTVGGSIKREEKWVVNLTVVWPEEKGEMQRGKTESSHLRVDRHPVGRKTKS